MTANYCFSQISFTANIKYNNVAASGQFEAYRRGNLPGIPLHEIRKPVIFVEGFDPNNDFIIDTAHIVPNKTDIYSIIDQNFFRNPNGTIDFFTSLSNSLHDSGHDIIILNFTNGGDYIQKNAFLLVELINQINANKPNEEDDLVVIGFSMGGLVARYALTYMEENNMDHKTKLYVSYDSPHRGAHIPFGVQALASTFSGDIYKSLFPDIQKSLGRFSSPAAKQMLKYRIYSTQPNGRLNPDAEHINFMNELKNLNKCNGYPKKCKNIGVSLGSWSGIPQRSELDFDKDGIKDYQHSAVPTMYINIPRIPSGNSIKPITAANTCEITAIFSFQAITATCYSTNYPYMNQRSAYGNIGNFAYGTYWYRNSEGLIAKLFPYGTWERLWGTMDDQAIDFAPGSHINSYEQVVDGLNTQAKCSFFYARNSTFIPTLSALDFNETNLFHNIPNDPERMSKTPFEDIWAFTNADNASHIENQTSNEDLRNWLLNHINGNATKECFNKDLKLSNIDVPITAVNPPKINFEVKGVKNLKVNNFHVKAGGNVVLSATESIELGDNFSVEEGAYFDAGTSSADCISKSCNLNSSYTIKTYREEYIKDDAYFLNFNSGLQTPPEAYDNFSNTINIYPNPNNGSFHINVEEENLELIIFNTLGLEVYKIKTTIGLNTINLGINEGVYLLKPIKII